nr:VanW family protein [uncultured Acetatifactor sp.]
MGKWMRRGSICALMLTLMLAPGLTAAAKDGDTIKKGIFVGDVDLSGMTAQEAVQAVDAYVETLREVEITLLAAGDKEVPVAAGELGISWANKEVITQALEVGTHGNVIERYKILKDLERENLVYPLELSFDFQGLTDILIEECTQYDVEAVDASLVRENDEFRVVGGNTGYALDVEASFDKVHELLSSGWDCQPCSIPLVVEVTQPRGNAEELSKVKDVLGTFTTSYGTSNFNRSENIANGCELINGTVLYPGDEFSMLDCVTPFTAENGYYMAGSFMNNQVVDSMGGGICQVSTTLYNTVLLAELEVTERSNHTMIVTYVDPSADAAIAESADKDFRFRNNLDSPVYIEGHTEGKKLTFTIYGEETREPGREVRYESQILEVINPTTDSITADEGQPLGYIVADEGNVHIGYRAELWKIVQEDGIEVERTKINSSSYRMVPKSARVGVATEDPVAREEIMAAIGTGSIQHVRDVLALLLPPPPADPAADPAAGAQ